MTTSGGNISLGELVEPIVRAWRRIVLAAAAAAAVAAVAGGIYYVRQPMLRTVAVTFRPTFDEAGIDKYPGGQRFLLDDVIQPSIVDRSVRRLGADQYCDADEVGANLRARFLTPVHPPSNEVRVIRPIFQLVFERRGRCAALPDDVAIKLLSGILAEWASDAVERRGVLDASRTVVTPELFAHAVNSPTFVRADRAREAVLRVLRDLELFRQQPGAELIRLPGVSLEAVRFRLQGLMPPLERLIVTATVAAGSSQSVWLMDALSAAEIEERSAQQQAESRRIALHEYASMTPAEVSLKDDGSQVNREQFKQELTRGLVTAAELASQKAAIAERYRALRSAVAAQQGAVPPLSVLEATLAELVRNAVEATADLNRLCNRFSQTRVGDQAQLYRIERGPEITVNKAFALRDLLLLLIGVAFGSLVLLAGGVLMRSHWRWLLQGEPAKSSAAE